MKVITVTTFVRRFWRLPVCENLHQQCELMAIITVAMTTAGYAIVADDYLILVAPERPIPN